MFSWTSLPRPIIALAPMSGYTDCAFRQIVKELCPEAICFTEFTSIDGLKHGNDATLRQIFFDAEKERPIIMRWVVIYIQQMADYQLMLVMLLLSMKCIELHRVVNW